MLAELLEQDHRQQARAGKAARRDMERRRRLGDRLTLPAGEPFPDGLDHLPPARDDLERLGDILAEFRKLRRTAAGATLRRRDHDPLAGQMLRERLSRRPPALEGFDDCRRRGAFRLQLVLGGVRLGVRQLHLQLVEKPLLTFRAHAIERAPKLFDLQSEPRNQRVGARRRRTSMRQIGFSPRRARFALKPRGPFGEDHRVRGGEVGGERIRRPLSHPKGITSARICKQKSSSGRRRTPGFLRHSPIDPLKQIAELRHRDRHRSIGRRRPQKTTPFKPLGEQTQTLAVVP